MKVYIVYTEYQADTPDIEGVYATPEHAEEVAEGLRESYAADGEVVYDYNDDDGIDWTRDVHVVEQELKRRPQTSIESQHYIDTGELPTVEIAS